MVRRAEINWLDFLISGVVNFSKMVMLVVLAWFIFYVGPDIESRMAPVVERLTITRVIPINGQTAYVHAEFRKNRPCDLIGTAWYRVLPTGGMERVGLDTRITPAPLVVSRPVGINRVGPWLVGMNAGEIVGESYAEMYHRCHPMWITRSVLYVPPVKP